MYYGYRRQRRTGKRAGSRLCFLLVAGSLFSSLLRATTVIPISDRQLLSRADVVVHGVVVASEIREDALGRPETVTSIAPLEVLKGEVPHTLVLHQLGGQLPDGRFFKLWGRPEYQPGHEVVVFALARPEGDYQTAEMLLGKFEVQKDEADRMFAVPSLVADAPAGVTVRPPSKDAPLEGEDDFSAATPAPRELVRFLRMIRRPAAADKPVVAVEPRGQLRSVVHPEYAKGGIGPDWVGLNLTFWRWTNGASAVFTLDGLANITGGGTAEASNATATWDAEPNSTIGYSIGSGTPNPIHLNALSSPCGWSTCLDTGGVIGCGGPGGGGTNLWRGDTYNTISGGEVWLRSYCTLNLFDSTVTQSVLTHELGHTLGLGHSDQGASPHDICRGDEGLATMRSSAQYRTTLGTDDQDAVRWYYGDGGNSCTSAPPAPVVTGAAPTSGPTAGGTLLTISGSNFQAGATVSVGGVAATGVTVNNPTTITATTGAHAAGTVGIVVTNPDSQSGTRLASFLYAPPPTASSFFALTPCRVLDTRNASGPLGGPALAANADRDFTATGQCGIPVTAKALSANVTVTGATATGDLRLYPAGNPLPISTVINYRPGRTRANNGMILLSATGAFSVHSDQPSGNVQLIIDVNGYFQ